MSKFSVMLGDGKIYSSFHTEAEAQAMVERSHACQIIPVRPGVTSIYVAGKPVEAGTLEYVGRLERAYEGATVVTA